MLPLLGVAVVVLLAFFSGVFLTLGAMERQAGPTGS